jgi:carbon-monoxide dehydrogenase small subunit
VRLLHARRDPHAADLLSRDRSPSDDEIRHALRGNLCRCTGYQGIVESIRAAERVVIPAATRYARASDVEHALELLGEPDAKRSRAASR